MMNETGLQNQRKFSTESRTEIRFKIDAHCRFWWTGESEQTGFGAGRTIDVSSRGILVGTSYAPPHGARVMLEVDLPRINTGTQGDCDSPYLLLSAEGTVLRPHGAQFGFAAKINHSSFAAQPKE